MEVGTLAEVSLPKYGCELISLNEPMDDMMVFRNWFNEQHSKSTSRKVKAAKRVSAENGKYIGAYAPYGYLKDPNNRHKLILDNTTAPIVRSIFQMRSKGMGYRAIAEKLNEDKIIPPKGYYYQCKNRKNPLSVHHMWNDSTIKIIISNEAYIGNVVQGKSGSISYKTQKQEKKPQEEWIRAENRHEPLIDRALWDRVQEIGCKKHKPRRGNDGGTYMFTGLLRCADCGYKLRAQVERRKKADGSETKYISYLCCHYSSGGKAACTAHIIYENALAELVMDYIRTHAFMVDCNEERIMEAIFTAQNTETTSYRAAYQGELEAHKKQIGKLDLLCDTLVEDRATGVVPEATFKRQIQKYEQDRVERLQAIKTLEQRIKAIRQETDNAETWVRLMKHYKGLETLGAEALLRLIDKIIVSEPQKIGGKRIHDIQIVYKYVGNVDRLGISGAVSQ